MSISGYGIDLALKRTDYIVIDDRQAEAGSDEPAPEAAEATLTDDDVTELKPLSASELLKLDMRASSFVMESQDPLDTLARLTQDFPRHSRAMAANNISDLFRAEHIKNRDIFLPPGYNVIWINGVQILSRDFDAYAMLEHLRRERKLINTARGLGLTGMEAIQLLSHPAIADAYSKQEPQRYDWRDDLEGGDVIMWLNDIEQDQRYAEWPATIQAVGLSSMVL